MSRVTLLPQGEAEIGAVLDRLAAAPRARPFAPDRIEALGLLSRTLLADRDRRRQGEAVALGYWLRPANIDEMRRRFEALARPDCLRMPAGLAFHVPPANVDTMGIYSWALSFLCGNVSILRLSQRSSPLSLRLVEIVQDTLAARSLADCTAFVSYGHDAEITGAISRCADLRVIWGGDASIAAVRAVPLSPHAKEVVFADRLSLSVLSVPAWLGLDEAARTALGQRAFNDIYSFDQMGCSSPRLIVWCGPPDQVRTASAGFSAALRREIARRGYHAAPATALGKYTAACAAAIDWPVARIGFEDLDWVVLDLGERPGRLPQIGGGGGIAVEMRIDRLAELVPLLDRRVQTIAHFGFDRASLADFAERACGCGGDRLVPIGEALNFSSLWDGYDLLQEFTRAVELR
ncbi:MAG TPA: acyl-CoA reductase [Aliidongia sp.]|nr:acyl-CoA reductase [Aliidongia sp.]